MTKQVALPWGKASGVRQRVLNETTFCAWLSQAAPGETIEYHRGILCLDRGDSDLAPRTVRNRTLNLLADRAYVLAERGFVHLVQRRVNADTFSYLAVARPRCGPRNIPLAVLMSEKESRS